MINIPTNETKDPESCFLYGWTIIMLLWVNDFFNGNMKKNKYLG